MLDVLWLPALKSGDSLYIQNKLRQLHHWAQPEFNFSGKIVKMPRCVAWFGPVDYVYSGLMHKAESMPLWMNRLGVMVSEYASLALGKNIQVNSVLCNWYRDGQDSISFHSDDEHELGMNPVIISVSLGATRTFQFKENKNPKNKVNYVLTDGSVVVMYGNSQSEWKHGVPKEPNVSGERFNLTFRMTYP